MRLSFRVSLAFFLTYTVKHLVFWISNFDPIKSMPFWRGYSIDVAIWILFYNVFFFGLRVVGQFEIHASVDPLASA